MTSALLLYIVDNRADYRLLVEAIVTRYLPGCSLRLFASGQAFLESLPQLGEKPDVVILDYYMPQPNGHQTLMTLKQQPDYRSIPVVMMSGDASPSEINGFYQAGATNFVRKPLDFNALKETLLAACQYAS